jgi:hypothetical protein
MGTSFLIAAVIIAALVAGWFLVSTVLRRNVAARHDSIEDAMSDESEPLPSSHLIPDDRTAAGDTPEAHDEINPHDIPRGHPGRRAAEDQAEEEPGDEGAGTTRGDDELAQEPPSREERLEPRADQRR